MKKLFFLLLMGILMMPATEILAQTQTQTHTQELTKKQIRQIKRDQRLPRQTSLPINKLLMQPLKR